MREASFYKKLEGSEVHCFLCAQHCCIEPGGRGKCGVRENRDGTLWSLVYGKPVALHVDPIEKKPLYHFYPGTLSYSLGTVGCNFTCEFCQNADIAQGPKQGGLIGEREVLPDAVITQAMGLNCASISYTYTEPVIFLEYALDIAEKARSENLVNVFVTNGFMTAQSLEKAAPFMDGVNVDLKSFNKEFYKDHCGARLKPVLSTIERMKEKNIWVEVTTLVIPGLNDSSQELKQIADFLVSIDPDMPWHVSAFHPSYQMLDRGRTPARTLNTARSIGMDAGLSYVYVGNIPSIEGRNTYCRGCGAMLLDRSDYAAEKAELSGNACAVCNKILPGVGIDVLG